MYIYILNKKLFGDAGAIHEWQILHRSPQTHFRICYSQNGPRPFKKIT